jgi:hypothetical protein
MSILAGYRRTLAVLLSMSLGASVGAQAQSSFDCHSVSFKAILDAGDNFERELGGGLLFRVRSRNETGWFLDIVPAEANTKDYIYPVNLPLQLNGNQTLGPGNGETVKTSLAHPHEMNFLLNRSDFDRIFDLVGNVLRSYQTKDPDQALSDYTDAVEHAKKGFLRVAISSYKTDPKNNPKTDPKIGALVRIKLHVQITTPADFQFAPKLSPLPWPCHPQQR